MKCSRRDLAYLLPALMTTDASAGSAAQNVPQSPGDTSVEKLPRLATKAYRFNDLPVTCPPQKLQSASEPGLCGDRLKPIFVMKPAENRFRDHTTAVANHIVAR